MKLNRNFVIANCLSITLCIVVIACALWGNMMPATIDPAAASQAFMDWCSEEADVRRGAGDRYFALMTSRYDWISIGVGIGTLGGSLLLLSLHAWLSGNKRADKNFSFKTPSTRVAFFVIGVIALGWSWASEVIGLQLDLGRQMFPWCADTIIIPMAGFTFLFLALAVVCIIVGLVVVQGFGALPTNLFAWDNARPARSWLVTLLFSAAGLVIIILGFSVVQSSSSIAMPSYVAVLYLLLSTRAALLSPAPPNDG
jgi:hypothetical protein